MPAVFYNTDEIIEIGTPRLAELVRAAAAEPLRRSRICLHRSSEDLTQEMIIALMQDSYVPPHKHTGKSESFHVIRGELDIVFFDDAGKANRIVSLGTPGGIKPFVYRLSVDLWHSVRVLTEVAVFHETTTGPFVKGHSQFPPWAPAAADVEGVRRFMDMLKSVSI
jgi:cupin fold WbuC family metalloprotein